MNLHQMTERVRSIVEDDKLVSSLTPDLFNEGLQEVATTVNLPALDTWATITVPAAASNAALPASFMRELHTVRDLARPDVDIPIMSGLRALTEEFGVLGVDKGPVEACCEQAGVLYFAPQPTQETQLRVGFYSQPEALSAETDVPTCVPPAFHVAVLVNYVAGRLFAMLEDGMGGEKVMTERYLGLYQHGVESLAAKYPDTSRKRVTRVRRARWF